MWSFHGGGYNITTAPYYYDAGILFPHSLINALRYVTLESLRQSSNCLWFFFSNPILFAICTSTFTKCAAYDVMILFRNFRRKFSNLHAVFNKYDQGIFLRSLLVTFNYLTIAVSYFSWVIIIMK
jgi:hypothetical protein